MHTCPDCEQACYCDMEDHENETPIDCCHDCEDFDDEDDDFWMEDK